MGFKIHIPGYLAGSTAGLIIGNVMMDVPLIANLITCVVVLGLMFVKPSWFDRKVGNKEEEQA